MQSEDLLLTQVVACTYTTEALRNPFPTGEIMPTLAVGFEVRVEHFVVTDTNTHTTKRAHPKTGELVYYDSVTINVASPTFPDGFRLNERRILPDITTLPKKGSVLALHLVRIAKGVATRIRRELYAHKLNYPTEKPVEKPNILVEYLHCPTEEFNAKIGQNEGVWQLEENEEFFLSKWENFIKPISAAVIAAEKTLLADGLCHAACEVNVNEWLSHHTIHVTVDPKAQKPAQRRALHKFLTQNFGVRIMTVDKQSNQEKFLFNGIILNIENDDTGNVIGYNVKREIRYTLTKNLPKRKATIDHIGGQKQYPPYEDEEEPTSDDEPYLNEDDVVIRRKKKYIPWQGLERGIFQF